MKIMLWKISRRSPYNFLQYSGDEDKLVCLNNLLLLYLSIELFKSNFALKKSSKADSVRTDATNCSKVMLNSPGMIGCCDKQNLS